jgi:hypothetical protein
LKEFRFTCVPPKAEPYITTFSIIDLRKRERCSESFVLLHNMEQISELIPPPTNPPPTPPGVSGAASSPLAQSQNQIAQLALQKRSEQLKRVESKGSLPMQLLTAPIPGKAKLDRPPERPPPPIPTEKKSSNQPSPPVPTEKKSSNHPPPARMTSGSRIGMPNFNPERSCLFSVEEPHSNVFLLMRVEKLLRSDLEKDLTPYIKTVMTNSFTKKKKLFFIL